MAAIVIISPHNVPVGPGSDAECEVKVRNTGNVVDEFTLDILGASAPWAKADQTTLRIFPGDEATTIVRFVPPRDAAVPAGRVPFGVRVVSRQQGDSIVEEGTLEVQSFSQVEASLHPRTSQAKRKAKHDVLVRNRGNAPVFVEFEGGDTDQLLTFKVDPPGFEVPAGEEAAARVEVKALKGFAKGPEQHRPFQVTVRPRGGEPVVVDGAMRQMAGTPQWMGKVVLAVVALAALAFVVIMMQNRNPDKSGSTEVENAGASGATTVPGEGEGGEGETEETAPEPTAPPETTPEEGGAGGGGGGGDGGGGGGGGGPPPVRIVYNCSGDICAVNSDGSGQSKLTATGNNSGPALSPDRTKIVFSRSGPGGGLMVMPAGGGPQTPLSGGAGGTLPSWSGGRIAFARNGGIFVINDGGGGQVTVRPENSNADAPSLGKGGAVVLWEEGAVGTRDIFSADVGGAPRKLTEGLTGDKRKPRVSPDATRVVFVFLGAGSGNYDLATMLINGTSRARLPETDGGQTKAHEDFPSWTSDGARIAFTSQRDGNANIYIMGVDGANVARVTSAGGDDTQPAV